MASRVHVPATLPFNSEATVMETTEESKMMTEKRKERISRRWKDRVSFSASLPNDVRGDFADSLCVIRYSENPFADIRESILEMILKVGVYDWDEMEELVYFYVALNSPELHQVIEQAFLSICFDQGQNLFPKLKHTPSHSHCNDNKLSLHKFPTSPLFLLI